MNLSGAQSSPFHLPHVPPLAGVKGMEDLKKEAFAFLDAMAEDAVGEAWIPDVVSRKRQVEREINSTGTYKHTYKELVFGSRLAWRNSNRCIGRHFWRTLQVNDARQCSSQEDAIQH